MLTVETPVNRKRRTVKIADLICEVNRKNKLSSCTSHVRNGWNGMLEDILHANGVYAGYWYLATDEVPEGEEPGIVRGEESDAAFFPDPSRRCYYVHRLLKG